MKKIMILMLAGLMVMIATTAFAETRNISDDVLGDAEPASPLNWESDQLVWKTGRIDGQNGEGVVMSDIGYGWSKYGTNFLDSDGSVLTASDFGPGMEVTFILDKDRKTIVTLIKGTPKAEEKANEGEG